MEQQKIEILLEDCEKSAKIIKEAEIDLEKNNNRRNYYYYSGRICGIIDTIVGLGIYRKPESLTFNKDKYPLLHDFLRDKVNIKKMNYSNKLANE